MLIQNYQTTALEDWVTNWYRSIYIFEPYQINIYYIASIHSIFIHRRPMPARYDILGRYKAITLDSRTDVIEQREQFFHELSHILRHAGNQTTMNDSFRELQEWDATHFIMYASLPYHMIFQYDWHDPYIIEMLRNDFKVSKQLCIKRLEKINRKQFYFMYH